MQSVPARDRIFTYPRPVNTPNQAHLIGVAPSPPALCLTTRLSLTVATTIACAEAAYEALHRRVGRRGTRTLLCGVDAIPVVEQKFAKAADSKSCAFDLVSVDMCVSNVHSYMPLTVW